MSLKARIILSSVITIVSLGLAIGIWNYKTGKITIFGSALVNTVQNNQKDITQLTTHGAELWFNILVALILSGVCSYFILGKRTK